MLGSAKANLPLLTLTSLVKVTSPFPIQDSDSIIWSIIIKIKVVITIILIKKIFCRPRLRPALVPQWPPYLNFMPPGVTFPLYHNINFSKGWVAVSIEGKILALLQEGGVDHTKIFCLTVHQIIKNLWKYCKKRAGNVFFPPPNEVENRPKKGYKRSKKYHRRWR